MSFLTFSIDFQAQKTLLVLFAVAALASYDLIRRWRHQPTHMLFAVILGSMLSFGIIVTTHMYLQPGLQENPYAMAFAFLVIVIGWRSLFGPWEVQTKAAILGTFIFWIVLYRFIGDDPRMHLVHLIAVATALVPAFIWCRLFLQYHTERTDRVILMFLSGMLATAPILFYDALVRHGVILQFFLFRIEPESFNRISETFVSGQLAGSSALHSVLATSLLSFALVGLIEEVSKYWVLMRSGRALFESIDDVMQLSIVVAIGFAFAENIINPAYFTSFVQNYIINEQSRDIMGFLSNVLGRSVLTTMVHIVATGILGYFIGLAIFADPYLRERHMRGRSYRVLGFIHHMFRLREGAVFRMEMMLTGLLSAIFVHGLFNFLVTVPDLLPGKPTNMHQLLGSSSPAFLENLPLLLIPCLVYVVGGYWLLTHLFLLKDNMKERGYVVTKKAEAQEKRN